MWMWSLAPGVSTVLFRSAGSQWLRGSVAVIKRRTSVSEHLSARVFYWQNQILLRARWKSCQKALLLFWLQKGARRSSDWRSGGCLDSSGLSVWAVIKTTRRLPWSRFHAGGVEFAAMPSVGRKRSWNIKVDGCDVSFNACEHLVWTAREDKPAGTLRLTSCWQTQASCPAGMEQQGVSSGFCL